MLKMIAQKIKSIISVHRTLALLDEISIKYLSDRNGCDTSGKKFPENHVRFAFDELNVNFDGNAFTATLILKSEPTWEKSRRTSLFSKNRQTALKTVLENIEWNEEIDIELYDLVITNGIGLMWAKEK